MDNEMNVSENVSAEESSAAADVEVNNPSPLDAEQAGLEEGEESEAFELELDESLEDTEEDIEIGEEDSDDIDIDGEDHSEEVSAEESETGDSEESDEEYDFDAALEAAFAEENEENSNEKSDAVDAANEEGDNPSPPAAELPLHKGAEEKAAEPTESAEVLELRQRLAEAEGRADKLELRAKDALSSLGIEAGDDVIGSLEQLGAEQSDKSLEEYREDLKKRDDAEAEKRRAEAEKKARDRGDLLAKIEAKKKADIAAIHAAYPHAVKFKTVDELPSAQRFKDLRDAGASPLEAYAAVNAAGIAEAVGDRAHRADLAASKSHLRSVSGKSASGSVKMSASDYRMAKSILGDDVSDAELARIYKKVTK